VDAGPVSDKATVLWDTIKMTTCSRLNTSTAEFETIILNAWLV